MSSTMLAAPCGEPSSTRDPLTQYLDGFAAWLKDQGYASGTRRLKLRQMRRFCLWLEERELDLSDGAQIDARLGEPGAQLPCTPATGRQFLDWLRANHRVAPVEADRCSDLSPAARITGRYERFLRDDRGLGPVTVKDRLSVIHAFLADRFPTGTVDLDALTLHDATEFISRSCEKVGPGRAKVLVSALRCFLRHLYQRGDIATDIAGTIPGVPNWRLASLPKSLEPDKVNALIASCAPGTAAGRRDRAILLLLARLGLRAGEVVRLTLDDVDWTKGNVAVSGKNDRRDLLPMPCEVGEAVADYLQHGRPVACKTRRLFVGTMAPHRGFASSAAIGGIVRRAMTRAGITCSAGAAHRLRHSLATAMLRNGASLEEIGRILRHAHPDSTRIYAKVDVEALRSLAPAWPGGAS